MGTTNRLDHEREKVVPNFKRGVFFNNSFPTTGSSPIDVLEPRQISGTRYRNYAELVEFVKALLSHAPKTETEKKITFAV